MLISENNSFAIQGNDFINAKESGYYSLMTKKTRVRKEDITRDKTNKVSDKFDIF